jgi:alpha/beta superfamily hydrolase
VSQLIGIGLPLSLGPMNFLEKAGKPLLVIQGEHDQFGALEDVQRLVQSAGAKARLIVIPGADHFFNTKLDSFEESLTAALGKSPFSEIPL